MTLCDELATELTGHGTRDVYHFKRPDSPYPDFELALDASDVLKLDTFPPAAASRFPPEKKQFLRHSDSVAVSKIVALNVGPETCKRNTADDGLVGLASAVTPAVIVVKTTARVNKQDSVV